MKKIKKKSLTITTTVTPAKGGGINVDMTCNKCGGPIVGSDKLGMHCEKRCYDKENKEAAEKLNKMFGGLFSDML